MDMPSEIIQWLTGQAGIAGLAFFALYIMNVNYQRTLAREKEYAELNREDKLKLLSVLAENTAALTKLTTVVQEILHGNERGKTN